MGAEVRRGKSNTNNSIRKLTDAEAATQTAKSLKDAGFQTGARSLWEVGIVTRHQRPAREAQKVG